MNIWSGPWTVFHLQDSNVVVAGGVVHAELGVLVHYRRKHIALAAGLVDYYCLLFNNVVVVSTCITSHLVKFAVLFFVVLCFWLLFDSVVIFASLCLQWSCSPTISCLLFFVFYLSFIVW